MKGEIRVLVGLFVIIIMGSICTLHAADNTPIEETILDNQEVTNCLEEKGSQIEVIKLNYVKAEDVARVLAPLFSESARIIPYEPANSLIIRDRRRVCKGAD